MYGKIHSIQTLGCADGPGIRMVVFMQGCPLRCAYCHNPDAIDPNGAAQSMTPQEVVRKAMRINPYFGADGGVTFSGGEPLMQSEFVARTAELCREQGINTVIDTAGYVLGEPQRLAIGVCDMIILDIKHPYPREYKILCGGEQAAALAVLEYASGLRKRIWVRMVVVPGINDTPEHVAALKAFCGGVEKIELLPYHDMALHKWEHMGLEYRLKDVPPMNEQRLKKLAELL